MIFYGNSYIESEAGLQFSYPEVNHRFLSKMIIGAGYWFLVLSGLLILLGSLIQIILIDQIFLKKGNINIENQTYSQYEKAHNLKFVSIKSSSQINHFLKGIEEIIQE